MTRSIRHLRRVPALWLAILATAVAAVLVTGKPSVLAAAGTQSVDTQAQDVGPTAATETVTASLVLKVQRPDLLENFVAATQDPRSPFFHRFLSLREFVTFFAPSSRDIATITRYLQQFGITVDDVYANHLLIKATGTADAFDRAFDVDLHDFVRKGKRFHRPRRHPRVPLLLRDLLVAVVGPSNEAKFRPMHVNAASKLPLRTQEPKLPPAGAIATGIPGDYTVGDVANLYNINPLYNNHIDGRGQTVGIATLADFHVEDAFTYWSLIGLSVDPNRITRVRIDGGGELSADAGSGETSLDVEQSGGLAPAAKMIVYDAPNSDVGFMDMFYRVASDNLVDSLSVSWGLAEEFYYAGLNDGEDFTPQMLAFHQVFLESAAQGIAMFSASGDSGAYDANSGFNTPVDNVISVDSPSNDPAITAAGGTTTPLVLRLNNPPPNTPDLVVNTERVWGWDYIQDYLVKFVGPQFQDALFPAGTGGGVSIFWRRPDYQDRTRGIRVSEPNQKVVFDDGSGPQTLLTLPARFQGRNTPDVSLNADPFSGYIIFSTEDGGLIDGFGGTSFVAPQLNGISALLQQAAGGRIGLWNPMLYRFQRQFGYSQSSPFVDVTTGNNWFYNGVPGFEPGAGLGVLNVTNLAAAIVREEHGGH